MAVQNNRIESEVLIAAPVERVWELITRAEHLGRWFGDAGAEIDLRPGGAISLRWHDHATVHGRVEAVAPPRRFAYRWVLTGDPEAEPTPANSTLTEFTLAAEPDGTRVTVVESGFDRLNADAAERAALLDSHTSGWVTELDHLADHAAGVAAGR
ncbi:MAG TPA: SRPBCC family protein [Solirubrobacteraceae bacterium]|nr:SRPBCC family protein [Solirubrobacteraceae bacterium]